MAYGLQIFDGSGNLEIDISSRLARQITSFTITTPVPVYSQTINYYVTDMLNNGEWFFVGLPAKVGLSINAGYFSLTFYSAPSYTFTLKVFRL